MSTPQTEFFRLDPLTGCNNFLSFVETLDQLSSREGKGRFSILYTDMNRLRTLNETLGRSYGDSVIRWVEIVLREECIAPIFRTGGDEFIVLLTTGTQSYFEELLNRVFTRLNREGKKLGIPPPAARLALVHYDDNTNLSLQNVLFQLGEAMMDLKTKRERTANIYWARQLISADPFLDSQENNGGKEVQNKLRWIANDAIKRVVFLGRLLDDAQKKSMLDSISGLPNMNAALLRMDRALKHSLSSGLPFSVLLMDGDNLTQYNNISYAEGDKMIQRISAVLLENMRPEDFIARWRSGDEFIAILPDTPSKGAITAGERFCAAIRDRSRDWRYPTSISIGVATFPEHGIDTKSLVDAAEGALKKAKDQGKDRVIL